MKQHWVGTSWKMNKTLGEGLTFARELAAHAASIDRGLQPFVIPPFTLVREIKRALAATPVKVGAQNMHWEDEGAWTGEISPVMLRDCDLDMVEIGHSERREHFGETDETVGLKAEAAVRHGLVPLICIGETLAEREAGRAAEVLERQVCAALSRIAAVNDTTVLLAYEPVWAIGAKGIPATTDYADARHAEILAVAEGVTGRRIPCLYGGSVNAGNCEELIACPHIDGLFIGRAAWNVEGYLDILAKCAGTLKGDVK
jgi:triosephosphate isomerase